MPDNTPDRVPFYIDELIAPAGRSTIRIGTALSFAAGIAEALAASIEPHLSGGVAWGAITGTLSAQTDLQAALDAKTTPGYVDAQIAALVASSPAALDTLNELAAALGDDASFSVTVTNALAAKMAKSANLSDLANLVTARANLAVPGLADNNAFTGTMDVQAGGGATSAFTVRTITNSDVVVSFQSDSTIIFQAGLAGIYVLGVLIVPTGGATGDVLTQQADGSFAPEAPGGGGSGVVETIVAGTGISVDATDPANPIVTNTGGGATVPTGSRLTGYWTAAPTGYVLANGDTIGDATSGATRANADTEDLFTLLWTMWKDLLITAGFGGTSEGAVILDSAGAASTFGANAAADYAAHKRLALPDERNRVSAMVHPAVSLSGVGAGNIGAFGGVDVVGLTEAQLPPHTNSSNYDPVTVDANLDGTTTTAIIPGSTSTWNSTASGGSNYSHANVQPTILINVAIKL